VRAAGDQSDVVPSLYDRMHLRIISIVHDTLYQLFVDPYRLLGAAGLRKGEVALEVGCGPGFFTIPAAEIVGPQGHLYTIDNNPAAVERVKKMVEEEGLANVDAYYADAAATGLAEESLDIAVLFGILRSLKDLDRVLREMHRVLNGHGVLAVEKSSWSESRLLQAFTRAGLFRFARKEGRVYQFDKESGSTAKAFTNHAMSAESVGR